MARGTWSTQTELGGAYALTARQVGAHLVALGLKEGSAATATALADGLARDARLRDGTVFHVWHTERVSALLEARGLDRAPRAGRDGAAHGSTTGGDGPVRTGARGTRAHTTTAPRPAASGATGEAAARSYDRVVATDGSALGNPGPTGWAWVDQTTGETGSGGLAHGTNNIGELLALLEALRHAGPTGDLLVRADSQYVINVATRWAAGWRRKGWRKGDGRVPENLAIVKDILAVLEARTGRTDFEWVRGHAGDEHNERADALAVAAATAAGRAARAGS